MKRLITGILVFVLTFGLVAPLTGHEAQAAAKYITVNQFATALGKEMKLTAADGSEDNAYVNQLINIGIIKDGDFTDYTDNLTRGDILVLLSRADDYLYNTEIDEDLIQTVIEKRISDIEDAETTKAEDIAKGYIKGFLKGYSNGYYITNRNMKLTQPITRNGALHCLTMLKDSSLHSQVSPDGQLIRTTNLPKNADDYEYILASYPNKFYERKFEFMFSNHDWKTVYNSKYDAYPVEMRTRTFRNLYQEWPLSEEMDKYLYDWADLAEEYLQYVFNVDYRTIDDEWVDGLASLFAKNGNDMSEIINTYYIDQMKANHVIVESSIIAVEPSTFYEDTDYCMRAYVKYRITADDMTVNQNKLIYSAYPALDNLVSGEWREGIFDVRFGTNNGSTGDGSDFALEVSTHFVDAYNVPIE